MSNPIADTAEYFARWKANSQADEATTWQSDQPSANTPQSVDLNNDEARHQWLKVFNRISFLNPLELYSSSAGVASDDESTLDRDTFELMRSGAKDNYFPNVSNNNNSGSKSRFGHHSLNMLSLNKGNTGSNPVSATSSIHNHNNREEEKLPSAYDLKPIYPQIERERTYFKHPFPEQQQQQQQQYMPESQSFMMDTMTPSASSTNTQHHSEMMMEEENGNTGSGSNRVKYKWDRTLDRLKWIAHLQSQQQPQQPKAEIINGPSHTLATYYPPAFDPIFAAFAKDEYGRKLVIKFKIQ
jgi:hypothetical protein